MCSSIGRGIHAFIEISVCIYPSINTRFQPPSALLCVCTNIHITFDISVRFMCPFVLIVVGLFAFVLTFVFAVVLTSLLIDILVCSIDATKN